MHRRGASNINLGISVRFFAGCLPGFIKSPLCNYARSKKIANEPYASAYLRKVRGRHFITIYRWQNYRELS